VSFWQIPCKTANTITWQHGWREIIQHPNNFIVYKTTKYVSYISTSEIHNTVSHFNLTKTHAIIPQINVIFYYIFFPMFCSLDYQKGTTQLENVSAREWSFYTNCHVTMTDTYTNQSLWISDVKC
jgi:hypothetical protein